MSKDILKELKFLVVGDENIGKTTLLFTFFRGNFTLQLDSTLSGVNLFRKELSYIEKLSQYAINCWDVAGHDRFHELFPILINDIDALIVIIDSENEEAISKWANKLFNFLSKKTYRFLIALVRKDEPIDQTESYQLHSSTMKYNFNECTILNSSDTNSVMETFEKLCLKIISEN